MKSPAKEHAGKEPWRVVVVGATCVSEQGMAAIVGRDKRYDVCGGAHGFYDAGELIRKHQPDVFASRNFFQTLAGKFRKTVVNLRTIPENYENQYV